MIALDFLQWWYGQGWRQAIGGLATRMQQTAWYFSAPLLLRTLFAPWRRIVSPPGRGLDAHFRAAADNLLSRTIGFIVRLFVLLAAGVSIFVIGLLALVELVLWPCVPIAAVVGIVWGIIG